MFLKLTPGIDQEDGPDFLYVNANSISAFYRVVHLGRKVTRVDLVEGNAVTVVVLETPEVIFNTILDGGQRG